MGIIPNTVDVPPPSHEVEAEGLSDAERGLLESFGLTAGQKRTVANALKDAPKGLLIVAREARTYGLQRGNSGAGLLMHRIQRGEHFDAELALVARADEPKPTGWRYVHGSHGSTFIRDPNGTDVPPKAHTRE